MVQIQEQVSLRQLNTFGLDVKSAHFTSITQPSQLGELIKLSLFHQQRRLILGGGSNLILTGDVAGLTLQVRILGRESLQPQPLSRLSARVQLLLRPPDARVSGAERRDRFRDEAVL